MLSGSGPDGDGKPLGSTAGSLVQCELWAWPHLMGEPLEARGISRMFGLVLSQQCGMGHGAWGVSGGTLEAK